MRWQSFDKAEKSSPYRNGAESLAPEVYAELAEGRSEANRLLAHWNEAIAFQQEAIQRTPQVQRRWDRLARLYEASGQPKLADEVRQQMLQLQESRESEFDSELEEVDLPVDFVAMGEFAGADDPHRAAGAA